MRQHGAKPPAQPPAPCPGGGRVGRSTEAIAQPAARRPEAQRGARPEININRKISRWT
ncbi:MAG: hypothetical protein NZ455_00775 [Bacteroidia bacterium]|nr:hypothetical protein [Bacteroidia bacterium]MDW8346841.1 hypothetical protein [Bacteroidia bacterium]